MIQLDKIDRISSDVAYLMARKYYIEKFVKNTAIEATLNCFYNFPNVRDYYQKNNL